MHELARAAGVSVAYVSRLEAGKRVDRRSLEHLRRIAEALGHPLSDLLPETRAAPVEGIAPELWASLTQEERDLLEELARQYVKRRRREPPRQLLCSTQ